MDYNKINIDNRPFVKCIKKKPFWHGKWNKENICSITHARLRPGKNKKGVSYCLFLPCGHGFYRSAISEWVKKGSSWNDPTCPLCRTPFNEELYI